MKIAVVGHISRLPHIEKLSTLFPCEVFLDTVGKGALNNHLRALKWAQQQTERVIIMEDDAVPVVGFQEKAESWFQILPAYFISFYLGTSRPPQYQPLVDELIVNSVRLQREFISMKQLIHGVCYSPPPGSIPKILERIDKKLPADFAIGRAWGKAVFYPINSLVDHQDGDSVERHSDGRVASGKRVARYLNGSLAF